MTFIDVDWNFKAIKEYFDRHGFTFDPIGEDMISASDGRIQIILEGRDQVVYSAIVCDTRDLAYASNTMNDLAALVLGFWEAIQISESTPEFCVEREGVKVRFDRADGIERAMFSVCPA